MFFLFIYFFPQNISSNHLTVENLLTLFYSISFRMEDEAESTEKRIHFPQSTRLRLEETYCYYWVFSILRLLYIYIVCRRVDLVMLILNFPWWISERKLARLNVDYRGVHLGLGKDLTVVVLHDLRVQKLQWNMMRISKDFLYVYFILCLFLFSLSLTPAQWCENAIMMSNRCLRKNASPLCKQKYISGVIWIPFTEFCTVLYKYTLNTEYIL